MECYKCQRVFFQLSTLCYCTPVFVKKKIEKKKERKEQQYLSNFLFQELNKEEMLIDTYNHER